MKTNKNYISPIDEKLAEFDNTHPTTASQQAEIAKHERIQTLRDKPGYKANLLQNQTNEK